MALGEFDIIRRYFSRRSRRGDVVLGVGDDAAVLAPPAGTELVAAVDAIHAGVHFPRDLAAAEVGHRALAVNLSDLAAMGAAPAWALLALSLESADEAWLEEFAAGLYALADHHGLALVGGDTVRGPLSVAVTVLGLIDRGRALTRAGARPGDRIWVSGEPGAAAGGLALIQGRLHAPPGTAGPLEQYFRRPEPRIALGRWLATRATAAIDVSDGLCADLSKLAAASEVGAVLEVERLPLAAALLRIAGETAARRLALAGGDDCELCFTAAASWSAELERAAETFGCRLSCIGEIVTGQGLRLTAGGRDLPAPPGYDHFAAGR